MAKDPFKDREAKRYKLPIVSREGIIAFMQAKGVPIKVVELTKEFSLHKKQQKSALVKRLKAMQRDGQILKNRQKNYVLVKDLPLVKAKVVKFKDGATVLKTESCLDVVLARGQSSGLMIGDMVLLRVGSVKYLGLLKANLVDVLSRAHRTVVGYYVAEPGLGYLRLVRAVMHAKVALVAGIDIAGVKSGDCVVAKIECYPEGDDPLTCVITEVFGDLKQPGIDTEIAIKAYDLPYVWSREVVDELANIPSVVSAEDCKHRVDLRHLSFVTIDGESAKDFDDAIYVDKLPAGGWTLWVAIADVSHYVKSGSAIDLEAKKRANSVYFPQEVLPMLPHELSSNLCSLQPSVDRLAVVAAIDFDKNGKVSKYDFHRSVINSKARLTYVESMDIVENNKAGNRPWLLDMLSEAINLHHCLEKLKFERGALAFNFKECKIIYNEFSKIDNIVVEERLVSHSMIENFMLCANSLVAKVLTENNVPALFRVHAEPNKLKMAALSEFAALVGCKINLTCKNAALSKQLQKLLDKSKDEDNLFDRLQLMVLKSMSQANYQLKDLGHFGLAYRHYTHFTSPIRRYADLVVHRALLAGIIGVDKKEAIVNEQQLQEIGEHCSVTERIADFATRDVVDKLKCRFMQARLGEDFTAEVVAVTGFGLFLRLRDVYIEGLLHITDLPKDYYDFDDVLLQLRGRKYSKTYQVGSVLEVKVARVNLDLGRIDFVLN